METARTKALKSLATSMPVANQRVAQGLQQSRLMGLQSAVAAAPAPGSGQPGTSIREIQQAGAVQAASAGDIANKAAAQTVKQVAQVGELGVAEASRAGSEAVGQASIDAQQSATADGAQLAALGRDVKQQLFDSRIQFERDEAGRKLLNESQMIDHAIWSAKSEAEFKSKMQQASLMHEKRMTLLEVAHKRIVAELEYASKSKTQELDQAMKERLVRAKANLELEMERQKAEAANKQAMWSAGGAVLGTTVGAVLNNPQAGAAIGEGLGTIGGASSI